MRYFCAFKKQSGIMTIIFIISIRPSIRLHETAWLHREGFSQNFVYGIFTVVCLNIPILIKCNKNNRRHLTWRTAHISGRRFFSLKLRQTFFYEVGDVAEEKVDFPKVTQDSASIKGNIAMGFKMLLNLNLVQVGNKLATNCLLIQLFSALLVYKRHEILCENI
jgi:hypothetical protein